MEDKFGLFDAYNNKNSLMTKKINFVSKICNGSSLLDIGCGSGEFISNVKNNFTNIVGIDTDEQLLKYSKSRFKQDKNIRIEKLDINDIVSKFGHGRFDTISALDVIEHLDNPKKALRSIYKVLKKNGRFLMTTPNWPDKVYIKISEGHHKSAHSSFGWKKLVNDAGFDIELVRTIKFPIFDREFLNKYLHLFGMCVLVVGRKT